MSTVDAFGMDREGRIAALKDNIPVGWTLCTALEVPTEAMYFCYKAEEGLSTGTWEHPEFGDRASAVQAGTIFIVPVPVIPSIPVFETEFPAKLINDCKMFAGVSPYDGFGNHARGDGYFGRAIVQEFGEELFQACLTKVTGRPQKKFVEPCPHVIWEEPIKVVETAPQTATEVTRSMEEQDPVLVAERKAAADLSDEFMLLMAEWEKADQEATLAVERERDLRVRIARAAFAAPKEGTNSFALRNGYVLKGKFDIRRIVDIASLATVREMMTEKGYNTDDCVRMKPELALTAFKALPEEAKKIMSLAITEKPGLPALEIVLPKRAAR